MNEVNPKEHSTSDIGWTLVAVVTKLLSLTWSIVVALISFSIHAIIFIMMLPLYVFRFGLAIVSLVAGAFIFMIILQLLFGIL